MTTELVYIHGINSGAAERAGLKDHLEDRLVRFGLAGRFNVTVAQWRSLGDFFADLYDLKAHPVRWDEAVEDVAVQIEEVLLNKVDYIRGITDTHAKVENATSWMPTVLFVGHSMGQPILVSALDRIIGRYHDKWRKASLLTLGGPMGNAWARPYLNNMPGHLWSTRPPALQAWEDCYNKEDPVNGGPTYEAFLAARPLEIVVPGHPTPFAPFKEHSSYFDDASVYALVDQLAKALES
jgi:hypothetical protein